MMLNRMIIAGGGTGGHIFPAVAIANALKKMHPQLELLFVGARGRMEMEKIPQAGYRIEGLDIAGFNRSSLFRNFSLPFKLIRSFMQVRRIFHSFTPDAVVGVGGYSSFPVLRYAQARGIPSFIHESNSFAGKSNIWLGKKATAVFVASAGMEKFFPAEKIRITGNPVRPQISEAGKLSREEALNFFSLQPDKTTVLVVGGSLGARSINEAIASRIRELLAAGMQLIWQTGSTDAGKWKEKFGALPGVWVGDFITRMEMAYAAADIVVSRAGAMAIAELCIVGKPVLFVPYPFAAEDHQTANARHLAGKNAALMIADGEAASRLVPELIGLAGDSSRQRELSAGISQFAVRNADEVIAAEIIQTMKNIQ